MTIINRVLLSILTALGLVFLAACSTLTAPISSPTQEIDLTGTWATTSGTPGFEATVSEDEIEIYILLEDGSKGLYWLGTFEIPTGIAEFDVNSAADVDALNSSLFGSGAEEKTFTYDGNNLLFEFEVMGIISDVELVKQ